MLKDQPKYSKRIGRNLGIQQSSTTRYNGSTTPSEKQLGEKRKIS
jgi:hypothetical protein